MRGWYQQGAVSCAQWLSWRVGMGRGVAREKVRVANALGDLPALDAALGRAELSYSKLRAVTRVATPDNEEQLLEMARHSTASQLEKICRLFRQCQDQQPGDPTDEEARRWVSHRGTDDGMVRITLQLRPDEANTLLEAMHVSAETSNPADGVVAMAEATLRGDAPERSPTEMLVSIDADTLTGEFEHGHGVSAETCRRLLCDAGVVAAAVDGDGNPLSVGRKRRTVPAALRRGLRIRDGGCRFPGCEHTRFVHAHHIEHWINGGETSVDNLVLLCSTHHRFVHEYGCGVESNGDGTFTFHDQHGRVFAPARQRVPGHEMTAMSPAVNETMWDGRDPQYRRCVESLIHIAGDALSHNAGDAVVH